LLADKSGRCPRFQGSDPIANGFNASAQVVLPRLWTAIVFLVYSLKPRISFGLLLLTDRKVPRLLLTISLLWEIAGVMPVSVGILEDYGLIVAGVLGTAMVLYKDKKTQSQES
jgi:hypothetical protein